MEEGQKEQSGVTLFGYASVLLSGVGDHRKGPFGRVKACLTAQGPRSLAGTLDLVRPWPPVSFPPRCGQPTSTPPRRKGYRGFMPHPAHPWETEKRSLGVRG